MGDCASERLDTALGVASEMFIDRGYQIQDTMCPGGVRRIYALAGGAGGAGRAGVYCSIIDEKLSVGTFKREMDYFGQNNPFRLVVFISSDRGVQGLKERMGYFKEVRFEHHCIDDMQSNVTRHVFVPKHARVDGVPEGSKDSQLPYITRQDPIVRYYAFEPGDVIEIMRQDGTVGYRIVH